MTTRKILTLCLVAASLAACGGDAVKPRIPTAIALVSTPAATAEAGSTISGLAVRVNDDQGDAMVGQPLTITVTGGGTIAGPPTATQAGPTPIGDWTLNRSVTTNTLTITSGTLTPLTVTVQGVAGAAANVTTPTPTTGSGTVGQNFPVSLYLTDANGNPTPGSVQFTVTGGGTVVSPTATADAGGLVASPNWILGHTAGVNTLTVTVGSASLRFTVTAKADAPASMDLLEGDGQTAYGGAAVTKPIRLALSDKYGNPTPNVRVTFTPTALSGTVANNGIATSDSAGIVTAPTWNVGHYLQPQGLTITSAAGSKSVSASVIAGMPIEVRFIGTMTDAEKAPFLAAVSHLRTAILAGGQPVSITNFNVASRCGVGAGAPVLNEVVQGIVIFATVDSIDGPGKILGSAGPCGYRSAAERYLPAIGDMTFDRADFAAIIANGTAEAVVTHEMLHTIGIGTLWNSGLRVGAVADDPRFVGQAAIAACFALNGPITCATGVPVENQGGAGTAGAHWRQVSFPLETMTGWITKPSYLSAISLASLQDEGYTMNMAAADPYTVKGGIRAGTAGTVLGPGQEILRMVPADPTTLERTGGVLVVPAHPVR